MPDRNSSGRIVAFTIGGAASAFGMTAVSASASAAKLSRADQQHHDELQPAVTPVGSRRRVGDRAERRRVIATRTNAIDIAWTTRARRYAHPGSGVPRVRFRIPWSRWNVTLIAMFV